MATKKSRKEVEAIVSGAGIFVSLVRNLVEAVKKFGGTMEQLYRLATPEGRETLEAVARIIAGAVIATTYRVADCFKVFVYRDSDLDAWLPATLPNLPAGKPKYLVTNENETIRQMAERELGAEGNDLVLQKFLVGQDKTFSLKQIEEAVTRHEAGDKSFGLLDDGKANLFFVEGADGAVFVVCVRRYSGGWYVFVRRFARSSWWDAGRRVFFRN